MTDDTLTHTYDWQAIAGNMNDFWSWMLPHILADMPKDDVMVGRLSDATDKFTKVEIKIEVSGIEVDAKRFFESFDKIVDRSIEHGVREQILEYRPLTLLQNMIYELEQGLRRKVVEEARTLGVNLNDEDER